MLGLKRMSRRRRRRLQIAAAIVLAIAILTTSLILARRREPPDPDSVVVLAVDRTESASRGGSGWPAEVEEIAHRTVADAHRAGARRLVVIGLGSNVADTGKAADVDMALRCPNERRCEEDLDAIAAQVAAVAGRLAATPPAAPSTDVLAALISARDLCGATRCRVVVASDLQDTRLSDPRSPAELAEAFQASVPSFAGIPVALVGAGVDGAPSDAVSRAEAFFQLLLSNAGSPPVITRNL